MSEQTRIDEQLDRLVAEQTSELAAANEALRKELVALRHSEASLQAIVDTTPECVHVIARDGTILSVNAVGAEMAGAPSVAMGGSLNTRASTPNSSWVVAHSRKCSIPMISIEQCRRGCPASEPERRSRPQHGLRTRSGPQTGGRDRRRPTARRRARKEFCGRTSLARSVVDRFHPARHAIAIEPSKALRFE